MNSSTSLSKLLDTFLFLSPQVGAFQFHHVLASGIRSTRVIVCFAFYKNVNHKNISKQIKSTAIETMQRQRKTWQLESLDDQVHGEVGSGSKPDRQRKYSLPKLPRGHLGKAQAARETIRGQFSFIPTISITSLTRSHARGIGVTRSRRI